MLAVWKGLSRVAPWALHALARRAHHRQGADPARLTERFGHRTAPALDKPIWFHGASIGEIAQIRRVAQFVNDQGQAVLITTGTATSAAWVARHMSFATHAYAPVDTPRAVARFLDAWRPAVACFAEGDLWPNLVSGCGARAIPLALLNPRPSKTRARFAKGFGEILAGFEFVSCKSQDLLDEFADLGVATDALILAPDLKRFAQGDASPPFAKPNRLVIVAASTHLADEAPVIAAFRAVLNQDPTALLIIAPRHPERGAALANTPGLTTAQRSLGRDITPQTQVYIADTTGELTGFLALADITFMGGSFGDQGGHNPYEAVAAGTPILTGPRVANFAEAYADLSVAGVTIICADEDALTAEWLRLVDPVLRTQMAKAAKGFLHEDEQDLEDFLTRFQKLIDRTSEYR